MLWVSGQRRLVEKVRIELGCADMVEFRYVEGRREGFPSRRNNVSNGVEVGPNGALKTW